MNHIKMDYDLSTAEERVQKVEEIIANTPPEKLFPSYLDELANYISHTQITKEEKEQKKIITKNRLKRMNMRETPLRYSFSN